jgi:hypothetical protein
MRAAAEPRADDADNSHDDEIQISGVPDGPTVRSVNQMMRGNHDSLMTVSRPTCRGTRLYRRGSFT